MARVNGKCGEGIGLDVKRFYLPGVTVSDTCPKCKGHVVEDFGADYLSYPVANVEFEHSMYCQKCDHNWKVDMILRVSLEIPQ